MPSNDESEKEEIAEKLAIYGISLKDYLLLREPLHLSADLLHNNILFMHIQFFGRNSFKMNITMPTKSPRLDLD